MSQSESRLVALEAARQLLIEAGPGGVTLKAVAGRIGRTHANLLHHFGSAAGLQRALAAYLAQSICSTIGEAVVANRAGLGSAREVVDLTFDAFDREGAGALASWMLLSGNEDALNPIVEAIHDLVEELDDSEHSNLRQSTLKLVLMALGDSLMGGPLTQALKVPRHSSRDLAEKMLINAIEEASAAQRQG